MPLRNPPILRVSDDVLECIIQVAVQDANGRCDHKSIASLSHVCARFRQVTLFRATFWNDLEISTNTSPDAVEEVLHRSQSVPLHIHIVGFGLFKRLRDSGTVLETLFEAVARRIAEAKDIRFSGLEPPESEVFSRACELVKLAHCDFHIQRLTILDSSFKDVMPVVGAYLGFLEIISLRKSPAPILSTIFHLAPNLEVIRISGYIEEEDPPGLFISEPPATGVRLQIVQLDMWGGHLDDDIALAIEMVQRYSPRAILDGRIVELHDSNQQANSIAKMELQRFNEVHSIICSTSNFKIQYPAWTLPTQRPVGPHALAELAQHSNRIDLVTRGFDADLDDLRRSGSVAQEVLCRSLTMTRSLKVQDDPSNILGLFTILAHDTWPMLEHISFELPVHLLDEAADAPVWNKPPIRLPRLHTIDIALFAGSWDSRSSPSKEIVQSCAGRCLALLKAISYPNATRFTLRALTDHDEVASVIEAVLADANLKTSVFQVQTFGFQT